MNWYLTGTGSTEVSVPEFFYNFTLFRTNQALKQRTEECEEAHNQLKSKLGMIQKEIKDQNNYIDKVKAAIRAKGPPLKVYIFIS